MAGRRRSSTRRRRRVAGRSRRRASRITRPIIRTKNRSTLPPRSPSYGNLAVSTIRRLAAYPHAGIKDDNKPDPKANWWLDQLKWAGSIAMQLFGIMLTADDDDELTASFAITGAGTNLPITIADLLAESSLIRYESVIPDTALIGFEEARVVWIRVNIMPSADLSKWGGTYAAAIVPCVDSDTDTEQARVRVRDFLADYKMVTRQPNSVVRPMARPMSISWSPDVADAAAMRWRKLQCSSGSKIRNVDPVVTLLLAFSDFALNQSKDASAEYVPSRSLIEVTLESRVIVRQPGSAGLRTTMDPSESSSVVVSAYHHYETIKMEDCTLSNGRYRVPLSVLSPECQQILRADSGSMLSLE